SPLVWLDGRVDLILDTVRGRAWFKGVEVRQLVPDTHPFKLAVALAKANGHVIPKEDLHNLLSRTDDGVVVRTAKSKALKAVKDAFKEAGRDPNDVGATFPTKGGGLATSVSAYVVEAGV